MPAYTILIMKRNETDKRPLTLHISNFVFWGAIVLAISLPILGFVVSAGFLAPSWLKLNFNSMRYQVEEAAKIKEQDKEFQAEFEHMKKQLEEALQAAAEAEAKNTMAETARSEATAKLTQLETEMLSLKQSVATYEQLLKPKLERELVQCVNLAASDKDGEVSYSLSFAKLTQSSKLPAGLTARVRVIAGDNALAMNANNAKDTVVNHALDDAKDLSIAGDIKVTLPPDTTRLIDVKVFDKSNKTVGYCWKTF